MDDDSGNFIWGSLKKRVYLKHGQFRYAFLELHSGPCVEGREPWIPRNVIKEDEKFFDYGPAHIWEDDINKYNDVERDGLFIPDDNNEIIKG
jgi:hypothetical protein